MNSKKVNSRKKYVATAMSTAMVASIATPTVVPTVQAAGNYSDVSSNAFYAKAVNELASKGIIGGYSDGTFQPNKLVTRAEAAKILAFDLGLTSNQGISNFSDVNENDWFFQPVTALAQAGGISGYEDGTFQPNKTITRAEMASLIVKAYGLKADASASTPFTDVAVTSWYAGAVQTLYANKVTSGKGSVNTFAPNDSVTRGEMAVFVQRASQLKSGTTPVMTENVIEEVTAAGVVISGTTYTIAESVKGLLGEHNAAILKGAEIKFEESNGTISKVNTLQLNTAGGSSTTEFANNLVLDGKGNSVGELVVNANYITVKNVTVSEDLTITAKLANDFYSEKLIVKGDTIVNGGDSNTVVFMDGSLQSVELTKEGVHFEATGLTTVKEIYVSKNAKITSSKSIAKIVVKEKGITLTLGSNTRVDNIELPDGISLKDVIPSSGARKNIKNVNGKSNSEYSLSIGGGGGGSSTSDDEDSNDDETISFGKTITAPGTYGPSSGVITVNGDLEITSTDVTIQNLNITGDLILSEGIAEGDVTLKGVTVSGQTIVNGGGENSIHFEDSVLATVIVNKNTGAVRIVASGSTRVIEVQLETPVIIEEENLDSGSEGFTNITIPESYQSNMQVELIGTFETINSRATNIRIQLDESTDIHTLILNAAASVLGTGIIRMAEINADGSTISTRPQNVVLDISGSAHIAGETIFEGYSDAIEASITGIQVNPYSISLGFDTFIAGLNEDDFDVTATLDGTNIDLDQLYYDSAKNRFYFNPVELTGNIGKKLEITVGPAGSLTTGDSIVVEDPQTTGDSIVVGAPQTTTVTIGNGFGGRITDIQGIGVAGARLKFRGGPRTTEGEIVGETVTDKYGYYSINLPPGTYTGELVKDGYITTYVIGVSADNIFNTNQNETAVRAASSEEIKIMLTWGEKPSDLDSHLTGPTTDQEAWFHTYYSNEVYKNNGVTYVDLDWDDTESYGPETTTIRKLVDGKYIFFVHNYSADPDFGDEDTTLRNSNAKVQIFKGNSIVADETFNVPTGTDDEYYWVVFRLDINNNGEDVSITPIDYLVDFADWDDSDFIPGEIQQFKDPRVAIQQKLDYVQSLDTTNSTLPTETLNTAVSEAKAVLGNPNATVAQLVVTLIKLLDAIEPFKDEDSYRTLLDQLTVELKQLPNVLSSITLDNYYDYEEYLDKLKDLIESAGLTDTELSVLENYDKISLLEEKIGKMNLFDDALDEIEDVFLQENDDENEIISNLSLITSTTNGSTVTWESSNKTVISNAGVVTRPQIGSGNMPVRLTATITNGDDSITQDFNVIVREEGYEPPAIDSISFIDAPGTEGVLTTGDTIQFTFNVANIPNELDGVPVRIHGIDNNPDLIRIILVEEDMTFQVLNVLGADYVINEGEVIFSSVININENKIEFRLEEIIEGEENINPDVQEESPILEIIEVV